MHTFVILKSFVNYFRNIRVRQLIEGGSDPSMISRLEDQKKQEERMREMKRVQEKHSSALLSREDAILAKQLSLSDVKLQAERVRKEVTLHSNRRMSNVIGNAIYTIGKERMVVNVAACLARRSCCTKLAVIIFNVLSCHNSQSSYKLLVYTTIMAVM